MTSPRPPDGLSGATEVPFAIAARRLAYRAAYVVLGVWWFVRRPHTRGVKLIVRDGDDVLFVRHTYGRRAAWELPGGGLKHGEAPLDAARREAEEELGLRIDAWTAGGQIVATDRATAHLSCFTAVYDHRPLRVDRGEIAEVRWAPQDAPPQPLGPHATEILCLPGVRRVGSPAQEPPVGG